MSLSLSTARQCADYLACCFQWEDAFSDPKLKQQVADLQAEVAALRKEKADLTS